MPKWKPLKGKTYGYLFVLKDFRKEKIDRVYHYCKCKCLNCGNIKDIRAKELTSGDTRSCGCLAKKHDLNLQKTGWRGSREYQRFYRIWTAMKNRCNNKNNRSYSYYGGRGIKICKEWNEYINFKEDMYESYCNHVEEYGEDNTTIDRIDVDGNYCKENCRWATRSEQQRNKRRDVNEQTR